MQMMWNMLQFEGDSSVLHTTNHTSYCLIGLFSGVIQFGPGPENICGVHRLDAVGCFVCYPVNGVTALNGTQNIDSSQPVASDQPSDL